MLQYSLEQSVTWFLGFLDTPVLPPSVLLYSVLSAILHAVSIAVTGRIATSTLSTWTRTEA